MNTSEFALIINSYVFIFYLNRKSRAVHYVNNVVCVYDFCSANSQQIYVLACFISYYRNTYIHPYIFKYMKFNITKCKGLNHTFK